MADETIQYTFESAGFPEETLVVRQIVIDERLDRSYRARVELAHHDVDADIGLYLGKDCVLEIHRGDNIRRLVGLARHVRESEDTHNAQQNVLVEVVPALHLLSLRRDTRIFQEQSVPEILEAVLSEGLAPYGREIDVSGLTESYEPREYCIQYQETDLDFVERLMQEEGISYTFTHEGERELMHLRDRNDQMPELASGALVALQQHNQNIRSEEPVHRFRLRHRSTITSVVARDWDWTRAGDMLVEDELRGEDPAGTDRESYEHGEGRSLTIAGYSGTAYGFEDSTRQARLRREAHIRDAITGSGAGSVIQFTPGVVFELTGHDVPGCDGRYLITSVLHVSSPPSGDAQATTPENYHNRFECIPIATVHRPTRRAQKPRIPSIQTAMVTGPAGEEIHVDEHGRIKVQFFWDRQHPADETSSCWVRCEQPWAGPAWGFWYVPRIGMEVVVHFVDGDPDRPLVSGAVYDGANALPYPLPAEKTKSTIKSNSSLGGGGFNELRFEDLAGQEQIYTHAQKDYREVVLNDHDTLVHNDQTNTVDVNQTQTIHQHQVERVDVDQTMTVNGNRTVKVEGDYDETVDGTETRKVTGDVTEAFDATETRTIAADLTETIQGSETIDIGADQTETILGSHTLTVSSDMTHEITGALTQTVVGGITQKTMGAYDVTATGGYTVVAPAGIKLMAAGGLALLAPGGVTHIDSKKSWVGVWKYGVEGHSGSLGMFKTDVVGMAVAVVGMKMAYTNIKLEVYAAKIEVTSGSAIGTFGTYLRNRGMAIHTKPKAKV